MSFTIADNEPLRPGIVFLLFPPRWLNYPEGGNVAFCGLAYDSRQLQFLPFHRFITDQYQPEVDAIQPAGFHAVEFLPFL